MLTADAFGVMPPVAKLTPAQAMYHFLSGYTAKVAGTERGVTEPEPEFSACFGGPFLPRHPSEYGDLLRKLIAQHDVDCWLVNTGWTGGKYGVGRRMPIRATRALLTAALDGSLRNASFRTDPYFGFAVPTSVPGVEPHLLYPMKTWADKAEFDRTARGLVACSRRTSPSSRTWSRPRSALRRLRCASRRNKLFSLSIWTGRALVPGLFVFAAPERLAANFSSPRGVKITARECLSRAAHFRS